MSTVEESGENLNSNKNRLLYAQRVSTFSPQTIIQGQQEEALSIEGEKRVVMTETLEREGGAGLNIGSAIRPCAVSSDISDKQVSSFLSDQQHQFSDLQNLQGSNHDVNCNPPWENSTSSLRLSQIRNNLEDQRKEDSVQATITK